MEQVVVVVQKVEDEENSDLEQGSRITIFPKLKSLVVHNLPKLVSICKGIESIEFPLLTELKIRDCPNMNCLVSPASSEDHYPDHYNDFDSTHLFCEHKVSFSNLKEVDVGNMYKKNAWCDKVPFSFFRGLEKLQITEYSNIRSLFASSIADNLVNLQRMTITDCWEIVKLIEYEEEEEEEEKKDMFDGRMQLLFPRLQELELYSLPNLESLCKWRCAVALPSLKMLNVYNCPELRSFNAAGSVITPALQTIQADCQEYSSVKDINAVLRRHRAEAVERERNAQEDLEEESD